jgi:hypothetical protein
VDLLVSGSERPPLTAWRPPVWVVGLLAVAAVSTAGAGVVAAGALQPPPPQDEPVALALEAGSVVATGAGGSRGALLLSARNDGPLPVLLSPVDIDVAGASTRPDFMGAVVAPGKTVEVLTRFSVPECRALARTGTVRFRARPDGGAEQEVELRVGDGGDIGPGILTAGCGGPVVDGAIAIGARAVGGDSRGDGDGVRGFLLVEVRNDGDAVGLVRVDAEVPGVTIYDAVLSPLAPGAAAVARLSFTVPDCAALRRSGRVLVTVFHKGLGPRDLSFRAPADGGTDTGGDVDLGVVLDACAV